jgi:hypothetical protein
VWMERYFRQEKLLRLIEFIALFWTAKNVHEPTLNPTYEIRLGFRILLKNRAGID